MCGFVGFLDLKKAMSNDNMKSLVARMALRIESRGPDDSGEWVDEAAGIALGHRRLSIIDLSPMGHQPMVSLSGRSVISYNGEVYNFAEIRAELEALGVAFRGHSDTEVLLEACEHWGTKNAIKKFIGMFAFAIWDRDQRTLTLARDRMGIKPLYWGRVGDVVFFGSQPKAFAPHPMWKSEINRDALSGYMRHNYIPAPLSIFRGIQKLKPGHIVTIRPDGICNDEEYWDLRKIAHDGVRNRLQISDEEAIEQLDTLLGDAVKKRMVADVPLGAFLSGGIDSSAIAALMQKQSNAKIKTFSIGFNEAGYDEAPQAKAVANHLGTDHTELYVEQSHVIDMIPKIPQWYDEPFADSSQLPTYLLSEMTRQDVTIALSGDGGDELFSGYNRYFLGNNIYKYISLIPHSLRKVIAGGISGIKTETWNSLFSAVPEKLRPPHAGDKMHKLSSVLRMDDEGEIYRRLITHWENPDQIVAGGVEPHGVLWDGSVKSDIPEYSERMQFLDAVTYLPDDILTKVDRASMAVSLETRVPIIDHRIVEFSWRLPQNMKVRDGNGKWILRKVLEKYVPKSLTDRPKMGFGIPIEHFLKKELKDWAEDLLDEKRLKDDGYFNPDIIRQRWNEHQSGAGNWHYPLWTVLMFQSWLDNQKNIV